MSDVPPRRAELPSADVQLAILEHLLAIRAADRPTSLREAADLLAQTFATEKVDIFFVDTASASLVAEGTSNTPMGREQHRLGLNRLAIANGGAAVGVFNTGEAHLTRHADEEGELPGLVHGLGIRSEIIAPIETSGARRGVLLASSQTPDYFHRDHLKLLETVARWIGLVAESVELTEQLAAEAAARERYTTAEELLAVVAHDLRNHLAPLRGRLDLLRRRASRNGDEDHARDAVAAVGTVDRLTRLVNDLLDAERLRHGLFTVQPEAVDLASLAKEVGDRFASAGVRIDVGVPDELWLSADPQRIGQCLENIVANAIKHSPDGGLVTVEVACASRAGIDGARVSIRDEGPGIPAELVPHLFDRFARSGASAGLGLGLFLASRIAEAHGGSLVLDSAAGTPAQFTLWLPIGAESG
jgi:two-component system OmpR family sensor kinase